MEELDLMDIFKIFWRRKIQMIIITLLFVIMGIIYVVKFVKPVYSSSTSLLLASSNRENITKDISAMTETELTVNSKLVSTYRELILSNRILRPAIANLKIDIDEETLKKSIKVNVIKDTELIEITVTNPDPEQAANIANEIASIFIVEMQEELYKMENVQVVDKAEPDDVPSNVNNKKDIAIFTGIGLIVSVVYVLILNMLDTTIKNVSDIENIYHKPVLVTMPICDEHTQKSKKRGKK